MASDFGAEPGAFGDLFESDNSKRPDVVAPRATPSDGGAPKEREPGDKSAAPKRFATFDGQGGELFGIMFVNFIFTVLTLGVYHFWAKVKVRKYLWARATILGSPLEYTGTGVELFQSFLIVFVFLALFYVVIHFAPGISPFMLPFLFWIIHFAMYRSIRFRLTRTRWRGIYANLAGSASSFANNVFFLSLANVICLGLLTPYIHARLARLVVNDVYWGSLRFSFSGNAAALYKSFFIGMGVTVVAVFLFFICNLGTLGFLYASFLDRDMQGVSFSATVLAFGVLLTVLAIFVGFFYYSAAKIRWFFDNLFLPGAQFSSGLPLSLYISLYLTNILIIVLTLGLGYAWVVVRTLRCLAAGAVYYGEVDIEAMQQNTQAIPKRGDGLLDALDIDVSF